MRREMEGIGVEKQKLEYDLDAQLTISEKAQCELRRVQAEHTKAMQKQREQFEATIKQLRLQSEALQPKCDIETVLSFLKNQTLRPKDIGRVQRAILDKAKQPNGVEFIINPSGKGKQILVRC